MIHANVVESGAFLLVAALTLLLLMFLYAVITAHPEEATRTEASLTQSPVLPPPALPVGGTQTLVPPVFPSEARLAAHSAATPGRIVVNSNERAGTACDNPASASASSPSTSILMKDGLP